MSTCLCGAKLLAANRFEWWLTSFSQTRSSFLNVNATQSYSIPAAKLNVESRLMAMNDGLVCELALVKGCTDNKFRLNHVMGSQIVAAVGQATHSYKAFLLNNLSLPFIPSLRAQPRVCMCMNGSPMSGRYCELYRMGFRVAGHRLQLSYMNPYLYLSYTQIVISGTSSVFSEVDVKDSIPFVAFNAVCKSVILVTHFKFCRI